MKLFLLAALVVIPLSAQTPDQPPPDAASPPAGVQPAADPAAPLPDVNALMRQVEANQRTAEATTKNYIFRSFNQTDTTDSNGKLKKSESAEYEIFYIDGIRLGRQLKKDGKDLSADEMQKQNEKLDKRIAEVKAKRAKAAESGKDPHGGEELSFSRILELGSFSNERREIYKGRPTILVDYSGDPKAKTHNPIEGAFKELGGTVWVDEQDKMLTHIEARFLNDLNLSGGLLVDVHKGSYFKSDFAKINNEVWFPTAYDGSGSARAMLFFNIHGRQFGRTFDYRKFKATATISAGFTPVPADPPAQPGSEVTAPPPPQH